MTARTSYAVLTLAALAAAGYLLASSAGAVLGAAAGAALLVLTARAGTPHEPAPPRPPRSAMHRDEAAGFPTYRRIREALPWASQSLRHYDAAVRPILQRSLAAVLDRRHSVDLWHEPERARALVGEDLWPLVDPNRPASFDSNARGVPTEALIRLVDRLETL